MRSLPPKWADRFLTWFCNPDLLEDLQGDLYEIYLRKYEESSSRSANILYYWLVLRSFRISSIKSNYEFKNSNITMTINNFKIALRVLWRDKFNTSLNLLGLTIGIACFLLLGFYVKQELSFDHFHSKKDRIYRSWLREDYGNGKIFFNSETPLRFESLFEDNFPEVEKSVQYFLQTNLVGRGENRINERIAIISPEFFDVFDFQLLMGDKVNVLPTREDLIISRKFVKKYFGDSDPIGKTLAIQLNDGIRDFNISAVFDDMPISSSFQFDLAISNTNNKEIFGENSLNAWFVIAPETYVLLKENTNISAVESKIQDVVMGYLEDEVERDVYNIGFQPLTDIHLNPDIPLGIAPVANPQYVYILGIIGILVIVIAGLNYTTLSIGQSLKREREVGMRKVLGATKPILIYQYLSESLLIAFVAMLIGTIFSILLLPTFNTLTGASVIFKFEIWHIGVYLIIGLVIGLAAGSYPSIILSNLRTIAILRGGSQKGGKHLVRKGMVVFQFLVTVFLISSTLIMQKQVNYLQTKDLGYGYDAVISVPLYSDPEAQRLTQRVQTAMDNGELLKAKLLQHPDISNITMGTHVFGTSGWANLAYTEDDGTFRRFRFLVVDPYYLKAFNIKFVEGRDFDPESGLDRRQSIIINKAAADYFGLDNPLDKKLPGNNEFGEHRIIGVTENFHFSSLHTKVEPLIIVQNIMPVAQGVSDGDFVDSVVPKFVFTYTGSNLTEAVDILKRDWESTFPNESLRFHFISDRIRLQYENETLMNKLVGVATVLSILIASLGLLGLTVLVVNSRIKEIGIRKVMGASPGTIFQLLSKSFSIQLILAIILSVPITIWLMNKWLENFAYRIDIGVEMFLFSGFISLLVAVLVILYHTLRASRINPVESLRME